MIDDGHAGCHSATVAENSSAGLKTSTMISTNDLGLGDGTGQNKQTSNSNRSHFIYSYRWRWRWDAVRRNLLRFGPLGLIDGLRDIAGTGHLNRGFDRVFEIVRVVSRRFVSISEVHAIRARPHLAQS